MISVNLSSKLDVIREPLLLTSAHVIIAHFARVFYLIDSLLNRSDVSSFGSGTHDRSASANPASPSENKGNGVVTYRGTYGYC